MFQYLQNALVRDDIGLGKSWMVDRKPDEQTVRCVDELLPGKVRGVLFVVPLAVNTGGGVGW